MKILKITMTTTILALVSLYSIITISSYMTAPGQDSAMQTYEIYCDGKSVRYDAIQELPEEETHAICESIVHR
jgi:hypothetical protein